LPLRHLYVPDFKISRFQDFKIGLGYLNVPPRNLGAVHTERLFGGCLLGEIDETESLFLAFRVDDETAILREGGGRGWSVATGVNPQESR